MTQVPWDQFKEVCYKAGDDCIEASVLDRVAEQDAALDELFDTSSLTIEVGGQKYILSLQVHKE